MFKRLLVPLDGSQLAESVLPSATFLASAFGATVVLFHVVEVSAPETVHGQRHLLSAAEARDYLERLAERLSEKKISVETNVHAAAQHDVAASIVEHIDEVNAELVVLCAHGRGGWRDVLVGNIAQQVISRGSTPIFFVQPPQSGEMPPYECRTILVPLDGTSIHEPALPVAAEVARACGAAMQLVTVVPTPRTLSAERSGVGLLLPRTTAEVLDLAERGAKDYLQERARALQAEGLQTSIRVIRGARAAAILETAQKMGADLIVLATHGRANLDAFWSGSLTPKVLARSSAPVLLVRVSGEEAAR